ncbi:MAG: hypothetical protein ABI843_01685 [Dokdonella sp.]
MRYLLSSFVIAIGISACSTEVETARIAIPSTNLTFVLRGDEKQLVHYQFFADGKTTSPDVLLGSRYNRGDSVAVVMSSNTVRISWGKPSSAQPSVVVDIHACKIIAHANQALRPPPLTGCVIQG